MLNMLPFSIFFVVLPLWMFMFIFYAQRKITCMVGMMGAMTIGMSVGLGLGTWVAATFPIPLFHSTMISMILGGIAGALAGLPVSLMAVLDGMLSGLMAGMMGAMLGEMISTEYRVLLLKVMGILTGGILFLLFIMLQNEINQEQLRQFPSFLRSPSWMFVIIVLGGIGIQPVHVFQSMAKVTIDADHTQHFGHNPKQMVPDAPIGRQIIIEASDFSFKPAIIQIPSNETVEVVLRNNGKVQHNFEVPGLNIHILAQPGNQAVGTLLISKPGDYQAVCTIPGHKEAGMKLHIKAS